MLLHIFIEIVERKSVIKFYLIFLDGLRLIVIATSVAAPHILDRRELYTSPLS